MGRIEVPQRILSGSLVLVGIVIVAAAALPSALVLAQSNRRNTFGHTDLRVPKPTDAGEWDGTWWYVNRDARMAIWLRTVDGLPELKFQFMSLSAPEGFATDWNAHSEYETRNAAGLFDLQIDERDANTIKGTWNWTLDTDDSARRQRGEVTIFRTGSGRQLVVYFNRFEFSIGRKDQEKWQPARQSWTFRKASKRLVLWDELPF
jgi:hypothetical protein